jgi:hypothetical protein
MSTSDSAGLPKDVSVLTLPNQVSLSNLTTIRSLNAGALKARAWNTLRAAVQGVTSTRAAAPIQTVALIPSGTSIGDGAYPGGIAGQELPRMHRGIERC